MLAGQAAAQAERITLDEFQLRINDAFGRRGMKLQLQPWVPGRMGPAVLNAALTRDIAAIAEMDSDDRRTLESVMQREVVLQELRRASPAAAGALLCVASGGNGARRAAGC